VLQVEDGGQNERTHHHYGAGIGMMAGDSKTTALAVVRKLGTGGTHVAMESASVTLVKGDLRGFASWFADNAVGVPITAGVLYPFFGLLLIPVIVAAAMSSTSVSVVGDVLRLRGTKQRYE
jgi:Cu+-exporting ATPase